MPEAMFPGAAPSVWLIGSFGRHGGSLVRYEDQRYQPMAVSRKFTDGEAGFQRLQHDITGCRGLLREPTLPPTGAAPGKDGGPLAPVSTCAMLR